MSQIVGDGKSSFKEQLTVNGSVPPGVSANYPFVAAEGDSWDSLSFDVSSLMLGDDASIMTQATPVVSSINCLSWAAIVFSTTVTCPGDTTAAKVSNAPSAVISRVSVSSVKAPAEPLTVTGMLRMKR